MNRASEFITAGARLDRASVQFIQAWRDTSIPDANLEVARTELKDAQAAWTALFRQS